LDSATRKRVRSLRLKTRKLKRNPAKLRTRKTIKSKVSKRE